MMKISNLQIENVKRVKAVRIEPTDKGLTILGGRNNQGKSSVLDSIAWALGGNRKKPSQADREGSMNKPYLKVTMNNGLVVERKGKNSDLKVTDPDGNSAGQTLLDSFVEELAIDLPQFMEATNKEKADTLLKIIGVGDQLYELEREEKELYDERRSVYRIKEQKRKYAEELPYHEDAPDEPLKISDLINEQQEILARNGENQKKRQEAQRLADRVDSQKEKMASVKAEIARLEDQLAEMEDIHQETVKDLETAQKTAEQLQDESTAELEQSIAENEQINEKVRTNLKKEAAEEEARSYETQYEKMSGQIQAIRDKKQALLDEADLPLPELSVKEGALTYKGQEWDNMSGSEQLKVSTAIVRQLKPDCGFVLIDKLEQMDLETMKEFGQWLESEDLQAIATRVSTGEECQIIIEDGEVVGEELIETPISEEIEEGWKGEF
ncbi:chromosome segregation protein SMC [Dolosigranulum pigrum]|uniref:AAA family ATPase n=2 Tax=Dolosigranulum pigrum TaxID=29394 RepID=A0A516GL38_9LACT|nr:AAA family ATPase [Dolosigranulum pigrum]QDO92248.1 AAA family ATPase [Dolosigranulum pigrum]QDO92313.1 AAA family ATPase [Dolosigranulum pigrum]QTJ54244.1 chromosome segregation protein SMC [Dolosigranulum pigrum]QTJ55887.1 chromosome segregation protein SMC [Dolosigranulum pigrum]